jgi:pimeloyl-ACP methyl ester carboxylesterase
MKAQTAQLNGIEMYYETEGAGEPLLLLHGGTGCHDDWVYAGRDQLVSEYMLI